MAATHESSVVFALNELRSSEAARSREKAVRAQEMAELARHQAARAARAREEAAHNAEELVALRVRLEDAAKQRGELEQALMRSTGTNQALETRLRQLASISAPVETVSAPSRAVHLAWAGILMLSCVAVYVLKHHPEQPARVEMEQALVASEPVSCPTPSAPAELPPVAKLAPSESAAPAMPSAKIKAGASGERQRPDPKVEHRLGSLVDPNCTGPLCGLPE